MELSERVALARKRTGRSGADVSKAAGLAAPHVRMIERGLVKNPELETLRSLAKALGVRLGWLASGEGPMCQRAKKDSAAPEAA